MIGVVPQSYEWSPPEHGVHTFGRPWRQNDGFKVPGVPFDPLYVPGGTAPGQQIQFMGTPMVGVPTAPCPPDDAAVVQYEQLLAGVTRIVAEHVPLQVRKDMLAVLVYRLTMSSLDKFRWDFGLGGAVTETRNDGFGN